MAAELITLSPDLLVIHYESLTSNPDREILKIHEKFRIPVFPERMACLGVKRFERSRRAKNGGKFKLAKEMFGRELVGKIDQFILMLDTLLEAKNLDRIPGEKYLV